MKTQQMKKNKLKRYYKDSTYHSSKGNKNVMQEIDDGVNDSILTWIGNTPLLRINKIVKGINSNVEIYAKAEWYKPGGCVKDRAALNMILEGERTGELKKGKTIIDATSGNTGISYALIAAVKGYKVKLALPSNASEERKKILKAYGVELILTDPLEGTDGAQRVANDIYENNKEIYFYPDQYNNPANWKAHTKTANEIWEQTKGRVTHFVSGLGTTGTFVGTSRRLKQLNPEIQSVSVQPDAPLHGLEGLKHLETAIVPGIYDESLSDKMIEVSTDESYEMVKKLLREEGLFVGISSGAAMAASLRLEKELESGVIVTVFPDDGQKYLSEKFWDE
jgi:S-sulfo-L-cysteine synthase (O-acetyl-L-serine-dependent)